MTVGEYRHFNFNYNDLRGNYLKQPLKSCESTKQ